MTEENEVTALVALISYWMKSSPFSFPKKIDSALVKSILPVFITDYHREFPDELIDAENVALSPTLQAILLYRLARHLHLAKSESDALRYSRLGRFLSGIEIYHSAEIGKGLQLVHGLGTVIGSRCTIGDNATIYQGVTLGDRKGGRPIIGNNVVIFAGSMVLGELTVGADVTVGANSVCMVDIPMGATAIGSPAKIIKSDIDA